MNRIGIEMHNWARDLFPICRSLTGQGVRQTLGYLRSILIGMEVRSVPSGYKAFDWEVPEEWSITDGYIETSNGERIVDFAISNLHVVGYSEPVDKWLNLDELQNHLYSLPDQPDAIPYVTSYYKRRWGFCLTHRQRENLKNANYHAVINSEIKHGALNFGEIVIPGDSDREVFLSTYVCHPSMANNELSGPVVTTAIARWLTSQPHLKYTYRIVFIPETIGSLVYLSFNLNHLKSHTIAGFNVSCIGDDRCYSYLPSRSGDTLSDRAAKHSLQNMDPNYVRYSWLDRGSDERQYCAPGIDLPVATIMRSKYGAYPEYHTSLDDLNLVTPSGLEGGYKALLGAIEAIEHNCFPRATVLGEPQLGKRGMYPTISTKNSARGVRTMMNLLTYADGKRDLIEIADLIGVPMSELWPLADNLTDHGLLELN